MPKEKKPIVGVLVHPLGFYKPMTSIALADLQKAVGGYVDVVSDKHYSVFVADDWHDANPRMVNLSLVRMFGLQLVGSAVITGPVGPNGETLPITEQILAIVKRYLKRSR